MCSAIRRKVGITEEKTPVSYGDTPNIGEKTIANKEKPILDLNRAFVSLFLKQINETNNFIKHFLISGSLVSDYRTF